MEYNNEINVLPVLALRGLAIFPNIMLHFDVGRKKSIKAIASAMAENQKIFLVQQKDIRVDEPSEEQMYKIGVVAQIKQVIHHPDKTVRVLIEGLYRARMINVIQFSPFTMAEVQRLTEICDESNIEKKAHLRSTKKWFVKYLEASPNRIAPDVMLEVESSEDPSYISDFIALHTEMNFEQKQYILEQLDVIKRLQDLMIMLQDEIQLLSIEDEISEMVKNNLDKNQREYVLREQLKAISNELGEGDNPQSDSQQYVKKILDLELSEEVFTKLVKECEKLSRMPSGSHEANLVRNYLDACLQLPWNKFSKEKIAIEKVQKVLDREHYGMVKVKERIIEMLAVRKLAPNINGQIICLAGPPGVGKTSIAKSIAKSIGREYVRIALGGIKDEAEIRGHRKTYIGAMPGRIMEAVKRAGTNNPLILLDEIDKLASDFKGDPTSALLEVLDSEQNNSFYDHYIDLPYDLSNVLFITTANDKYSIPAPLLDRMEIIDLPSYTHEEKYNIVKKHLLSKQIKKHGLTSKQLRISDLAIHEIIDRYTKEAGVRTLEREIAKICRKTAKEIVSDETTKVSVTPKNLENYLGLQRFKKEEQSKVDQIGVINGLAWTSVGGELLSIEVAVLPGTGKIELTGSLGTVMKESAKTALSYVRSIADKLNLPENFYQVKDIHIHAPEGAVPKDGPSAGIAMTTALISALTLTPIPRDIAMTGEVTLRGNILAIGGLKEKTMAAYRNDIKRVVIPFQNCSDLEEIDSIVKDNIKFVSARIMDTVIKEVFGKYPRYENNEKIQTQLANEPILHTEIPRNSNIVAQ